MQQGHLRVPVQHLTSEPDRHTLRCAAEALGLEGFAGDISVDVAALRTDARIRLDCAARGNAELLCDRCAEVYVGEVASEFEIWYVIGAYAQEDEMRDDAVPLGRDQREVIIDDFVREYMLVAMPMKRLCRDACLGICPTCGHNRNVEPCDCPEEPVESPFAGL